MSQEVHRKGVLQKLKRLITNDDQYIEKCAKRSSILKVSGLALVIASIIECFSVGMPSWFILAQGLIGSFLMCMGIVLTISIRDWSVLREFLNYEKLSEQVSDESV